MRTKVFTRDKIRLAIFDLENDQKKPNQKKSIAKRSPIVSGDGAMPAEKGSEAVCVVAFPCSSCAFTAMICNDR